MDSKFELKDITLEHEANSSRKYTIGFSDGKKQKFITLSGKGKIKELANIQ